MSLLILTEENGVALKRATRGFLPQISSAHLSEGLAFALGFNTHAALRASMAADQQHLPYLVTVDMSRFEDRISRLGYEVSVYPDLAKLVRSSAIPDRPFVEFKKGDMVANDIHFHRCKRANRPMMMVKVSRTYAELEWDCITTSKEGYDNHLYGSDNGRKLADVMVARFQSAAKGAPGKPNFLGGAFTGWAKKLLPETARDLAEDYFKLLYLANRIAPTAKAGLPKHP